MEGHEALENYVLEVTGAQGLHNAPITGSSENMDDQGTGRIQEPVPDQDLDLGEDFDQDLDLGEDFDPKDLQELLDGFRDDGFLDEFGIGMSSINNTSTTHVTRSRHPPDQFEEAGLDLNETTDTNLPVGISGISSSPDSMHPHTLPHYPPVAPTGIYWNDTINLPALPADIATLISGTSSSPNTFHPHTLPHYPPIAPTGIYNDTINLPDMPTDITRPISGTSSSPNTIQPHTRSQSHYRLIAPAAPAINDNRRCYKWPKKSSSTIKRRYNGKPGADRKFFIGQYVIAAITKQDGSISLEAWRIDRTESQDNGDRRYPVKIFFTAYTFPDDKDISSEIPSKNGIPSEFDTKYAEGTILTACSPLTSKHTFPRTHIGPAHKDMAQSGAKHARAFGPCSNCHYCMMAARKAV